MELVKICPEIGIVMDVDTGMVAEMRKDILVVDLNPIKEEINKLETLSKAFENSLDPRCAPLKAYDGRDNIYSVGGLFQSVFFGFWISLSILTLGLLLVIGLYPKLIGL